MRTDSWNLLFAAAMLGCLHGTSSLAAETAPKQHSIDAPRVWTDVTGRYTRTGVLVEVRADGIRLRQPSGRHTTIAWDKLSPRDQQYARDFADRTVGQVSEAPRGLATRIWTDATGRLHATAALIAVRGDLAVLQRPGGKYAAARLDNLSRQDQEFVRAFVEQTAAADAAARDSVAQSAVPRQPVPAPVKIIVKTNEPAADVRAAGADQSNIRARLIASAPFPLLSTWDQQSAPPRVIYLQVSRRFLDQFVPHDVNTHEAVSDVIVGTPVSGSSTTHGQGSIVLVPNSQQAIADILFGGSSSANTVSNSGRAQVSSYSTTNFQARKRIVLDTAGLHALPTTSTACSNAQTCNICTSLPGLRGAIARRITARRTDESRGQANQEAASHFEQGLNRQLDHDVAASLVDLERFQKRFFGATRQGGLNLRTQYSTTADRLDMSIYRRPLEPGQADPLPPAIAGDPPAALWIHNSFLQQVLADSSLRSALEPMAEGFLNPGKPGSGDATSPSPSDWKIGWTQDGSWMTLSFELHRPRTASGKKSPTVGTVAVQSAAK